MSANVKHHGEGLFKKGSFVFFSSLWNNMNSMLVPALLLVFPLVRILAVYNPMRCQLDLIAGDICLTSLLL